MCANLGRIYFYGKCRKLWPRSKILSKTVFSESQCSRKSLNTTAANEEDIEITFSNGESLHIKSGKLAKLADGCATVSMNDSSVMATAVSLPTCKTSSFVPLTVSFQQKASAVGRIPLNFFRREIGQTENEILTSRMIDRSVRPLFPKGFNWETQVIVSSLALDGKTLPDVLAINAASAALALSDIPWNGPVGAVRVGMVDENVLINPSKQALAESRLNLVMCAKENKLLVMLEGQASNIYLHELLKAVSKGMKECSLIIGQIINLKNKIGKKKRNFEPIEISSELKKNIEVFSVEKLKEIFSDYNHDKLSRDKAVSELCNQVLSQLQKEGGSVHEDDIAKDVFHSVCRDVFRELILDTEFRCDGRDMNSLRPVNCEVSLHEPLHGSALFQRGQTQVMCTVVLDSPDSALKMDRVTMMASGLKEKNFFVHYDFPAFATREIGKTRSIGRREMGHGALAEKALKANVPSEFPFTIRLTSEVLESNGSSSMATVCGGSLALMDAGVPMKSACAGVAMGLVTRPSKENPEEYSKYKILTDLSGIEDHFGDMDFKIAGTNKTFTALQMDIKNSGISMQILSEILTGAKEAIKKLLQQMNAVLDSPRTDKENWPAIEKIVVAPHQRAKFVGPGGFNIKKLEVEMGVEITEENTGEFTLFAPNSKIMEEAKAYLNSIQEQTKERNLEFGGIYEATITEIREHGCLVTLYPNMQPVLIHVTQLDQRKVHHPSALGLEVGQVIKVKYFGRDPVSGMMRLSRKVLQGVPSQVAYSFVKKEAAESGDL